MRACPQAVRASGRGLCAAHGKDYSTGMHVRAPMSPPRLKKAPCT